MAQELFFTNNTKSEDLILEHWWVTEGEMIHHDQQIASVRDGDRIYLVRAPFEGILYQKYLNNNESFNRQAPLAKIISKEEAGNIKISGKLSDTERKIIHSIHINESGKPSRKRIHIKASPSARRKARINNVDLEQITGTGPNGRIQLLDVNEYIRQNLEVKEEPKNFKNKTLRFGLPLTGLARKLAQKYNIDTSKIPAPPGANRIKREDVERYIQDPEGAVAKLEALYNIFETSDLKNPVVIPVNILPQVQPGNEPEGKQEEAHIIRLATTETSTISSGPTIELDTEKILSLEKMVSNLLLEAPKEVSESVIRLPSLEANVIPSGSVIELTTSKTKEPLYLLPFDAKKLEEPAPGKPIRLPSTEEITIPSEGVIVLTSEDIKLLTEQTGESIEEKRKKILAKRKQKGINIPIILLPEELPETEIKEESSESQDGLVYLNELVKDEVGNTPEIQKDKEEKEISGEENSVTSTGIEEAGIFTVGDKALLGQVADLEKELADIKAYVANLKDILRARLTGLGVEKLKDEVKTLRKSTANLKDVMRARFKEIENQKSKPGLDTELLQKQILKQQQEINLLKDTLRARFNGLGIGQLNTEVENLKTQVTRLSTQLADQKADKLDYQLTAAQDHGHLVTLVNVNLIELVKKYQPKPNEIGQFLKNYILSSIYQVYRTIKPDCKIYYIADINTNSIASYQSDDINTVKESISAKVNRDDVKLSNNDLTVVELLPYNLAGVSGLLEDNTNVLYISYIKDLNQFFTEKVNIRSILEFSLDFNLDDLSAEEAITFTENLRKKLESLEVQGE